MTSFVLGAGMTGLAAARATRLSVFEAADRPGGICSSYYRRVDDDRVLASMPSDEEAYRFELGGGHWLFGGDAATLEFVRSLVPISAYDRRSSVFFPDRDLLVPYPIQNHLRFLTPAERSAALDEMLGSDEPQSSLRTMADWLDANFGKTLGELFFHPFHDSYTAGLWRTIAPQDPYKSPLDRSAILEGATREGHAVGYNTRFLYPTRGLDALARALASSADVRYGAAVTAIDADRRELHFADGTGVSYDSVITTLPLNRMLELVDLHFDVPADPYTSVLVVNIGAVKGRKCPSDHWVYVSRSDAGFHRVGFYSNVDSSFVPRSRRDVGNHVSIYVEAAFLGGRRPDSGEIARRTDATIATLRDWEWIGDVEVVDPTWIDVAYTWSWPGSTWVQESIDVLESKRIYPVGRYARWVFQGIADSIRDGLSTGDSFGVRAGS